MTYAYDEMICGFQVLPFPEKPEYLPVSDEEFRQETLVAWSWDGYRERITAALRGGEREWAILYKDKDFLVRGAVMCKASEKIQLKMLREPEPAVRKLLAQYGTDRVRSALLAQGEADPEVLVEIAKWGSVQVKNRILPLMWDRPEILRKIAPFLGSRGLRILEKHPDQDVQFCAALYGSREKCRCFLDAVKGKKDPNSWLKGEQLSTRLEELEQVHEALFGGQARTIKYEELER